MTGEKERSALESIDQILAAFGRMFGVSAAEAAAGIKALGTARDQITREEQREWLTVTTLGSKYEQQMSSCGRYWRHRPLDHGKMAAITGQSIERGLEPIVDLAWTPGKAPD